MTRGKSCHEFDNVTNLVRVRGRECAMLVKASRLELVVLGAEVAGGVEVEEGDEEEDCGGEEGADHAAVCGEGGDVVGGDVLGEYCRNGSEYHDDRGVTQREVDADGKRVLVAGAVGRPGQQ